MENIIIEIGGKKYRQTFEEIVEEVPEQEKNHISGYERVAFNYDDYYYIASYGATEIATDCKNKVDNAFYETANYYTNSRIAEDNAKADSLMRKLRRFSAENLGWKIDWENYDTKKYYIYYDGDDVLWNLSYIVREPFQVYFYDVKIVEAAIKEFKEELEWFFTKYKWVL